MNRAQTILIAFAWALICAMLTVCASIFADHLDYSGPLQVTQAILFRCLGFTALMLGLRGLVQGAIVLIGGPSPAADYHLGIPFWIGTIAYCVSELLSRSTYAPGGGVRVVALGLIFGLLLFQVVRNALRSSDAQPAPNMFARQLAVAFFMVVHHALALCVLYLWINQPTDLGKTWMRVALIGGSVAGIVYAIALRNRRLAYIPIYILLAISIIVTPIVLRVRQSLEYAQWNLESPGGAPQKIILITVDTLRADSLYPTDGRAPTAPNLRAFAEANHNFVNASSAAPWTLPAFTSVLTGMDSSVHGVGRDHMQIPASMQTLPEILEEQNYLTAAIVFNYMLAPAMNAHQGFYEYTFVDTQRVQDKVARALTDLGMEAKPRFERRKSDKITELALKWLSANSERRYFLWLHYLDPHMPYSPPEEFLTPETDIRFGKEFQVPREFRLEPLEYPPDKQRWLYELYRGETAYVDHCVKQILDQLRKLDDYEDALIIFTSDHGEEFWDHDWFEHGHSGYEEVMRVPLVIKLPGEEHAVRYEQRVATPQLFPTILELLDIAYHPDLMDYKSLTPMFGDSSATATMSVVHGGSMLYGDEKDVVYARGLKLIRNAATSRVELYDLAADPKEKHDLASQRPDDVRALSAMIQAKHDAAPLLQQQRGISNAPSQNPLSDETLKNLQKIGYVQ